MDSHVFWLADEQFARLKPHLPTDSSGKARVDGRRVISGIAHVLKSGCRWVDAPSTCGPPAQALIDASAVKAHWCAAGGKGGRAQAIGRSRGGRTTKIHALTDALSRPSPSC